MLPLCSFSSCLQEVDYLSFLIKNVQCTTFVSLGMENKSSERNLNGIGKLCVQGYVVFNDYQGLHPVVYGAGD